MHARVDRRLDNWGWMTKHWAARFWEDIKTEIIRTLVKRL